jgi:peptide/nickel transport system permease protein
MLRSRTGILGVGLTSILVLAALIAPALAPFDPFSITGPSLSGPTATHPMGTDALGRDLLSGVLYGARTSLIVAVGTGAIALVLGVLVGATSGYVGGWIDNLLMRITEMFQTLPRFFLAIIVIALFGPGLDRLVLVLGFTSWALLARVLRSEVLAIREEGFVQAAIATGSSDLRIVVREVLPNALPSGIVFLALLMGQVMLIEAGLGFLGLGDPSTMSWGALAGQAQQFLRVAWWLSVFPGAAIVIAVLGMNLLADGLNDALGGHPG